MRYELLATGRFKKDLKAMTKRGYDIGLLEGVVDLLLSGEPLSLKYRDHPLGGNWQNHRECHIAPDWLLIYKIEKDVLVLVLTRTGTHSDLF